MDTDLERISLGGPRINHLGAVVRDREWCPVAITNSLCVKRVRVTCRVNTTENDHGLKHAPRSHLGNDFRRSRGHPLLQSACSQRYCVPEFSEDRLLSRLLLVMRSSRHIHFRNGTAPRDPSNWSTVQPLAHASRLK